MRIPWKHLSLRDSTGKMQFLVLRSWRKILYCDSIEHNLWLATFKFITTKKYVKYLITPFYVLLKVVTILSSVKTEYNKLTLDDGLEEMWTSNHIWKQKQQLVDIGYCHCRMDWGFSVVRSRGSGYVCLGLWKVAPYSAHDLLDSQIPIGTRGECYDCYLLVSKRCDKVFR